jgi:hypothetical protein
LGWLLQYAEKNNITLPEKDKIVLALDRAMEIAEKLPTKDEQPHRNTSETEHYQIFGSVELIVV